MKRLMAMLAALALCVIGSAAAQSDGAQVLLEPTGYAVTVPAQWTKDEGSGAYACYITPDENGALLLQLARFPKWTYEDFKAELVAASARNGAADIAQRELDGRTWLTHRMELDTARCLCAITALPDGCFLTVEFRGLRDKLPEDVFGEDIDAILMSLEQAGL